MIKKLIENVFSKTEKNKQCIIVYVYIILLHIIQACFFLKQLKQMSELKMGPN